MKNLKKISIYLMLPLLLLAVGCDEDSNFGDGNDPTFGWVEFNAASSSLAVGSTTTEVTIPVNFTAPVNKEDLLVDYTVSNVVGNASAGDVLSGLSGTLIISADTNMNSIVLPLQDDAAVTVAINEAVSFDVTLTSANRGVAVGLDEASVLVHRVNLVCDIVLDIGGMYSVTTTYGYHDFLPTFNPNTEDTEIVDNGDGTFFVQDMSGGLYNGGPYTDAYGTGATSFDLTFFNVCKDLDWTGQSDGYGAAIPLAGGENSVDLTTGVVTLSWFCEGYGENGVSVYTPL